MGSVRGPGSVRCAAPRRQGGSLWAEAGQGKGQMDGGGDPCGGRTGEIGSGVGGTGGPGGERPAGSHVSWEPWRRGPRRGSWARPQRGRRPVRPPLSPCLPSGNADRVGGPPLSGRASRAPRAGNPQDVKISFKPRPLSESLFWYNPPRAAFWSQEAPVL